MVDTTRRSKIITLQIQGRIADPRALRPLLMSFGAGKRAGTDGTSWTSIPVRIYMAWGESVIIQNSKTASTDHIAQSSLSKGSDIECSCVQRALHKFKRKPFPTLSIKDDLACLGRYMIDHFRQQCRRGRVSSFYNRFLADSYIHHAGASQTHSQICQQDVLPSSAFTWTHRSKCGKRTFSLQY